MATQIRKKDVEEYKRCKEDPVYFIEKYIKIVTVDHGLRDFKLYDYQKKIIETLKDNRFVLILQARQSGKTALISAYLVWKALYFGESSHCIVANKHETAKAIMQRVKMMYDCLDKDTLPYLQIKDDDRWSKTEIGFTNKSYIMSCATSNNSARGLSLNTLYIDEANFIGTNGTKDDEFLQSVMPTISSGKSSQFILTSSAGSQSGFYYSLYKEAKEGKNEFKVLEVNWEDVPDYVADPDFRDKMISKIGEDQFEQEFNNNFKIGLNVEEVLYFDTEKIKAMNRVPYSEFYAIPNLFIKEMPNNANSYISTIDISEGINRDYSVISIYKVDFSGKVVKYDLVGYYRSNSTPPFQLSKLIKKVDDIFRFKSIIIERNGPGCAVIDTLVELYEMKNIYLSENKKVPGISIKQINKQEGMIALKNFLENENKISIESDIFLNEIVFYTSKGRCKKGYDDTVSTAILLSYVIQNEKFDEQIRQIVFEDEVDVYKLIQYNYSNDYVDNTLEEEYIQFFEVFGYPGEQPNIFKVN